MTLPQYITKYVTLLTSVFQNTPNKNITAEKMRAFAQDLAQISPHIAYIDSQDAGNPNNITLPATDAKIKKYVVEPSAMEVFRSSAILFNYPYSSINPASFSGEQIQIFFRAFQTTNIQFFTFNYDYFTDNIPVEAGKWYKLTVDIISIAESNTPSLMATIQEIIAFGSN